MTAKKNDDSEREIVGELTVTETNVLNNLNARRVGAEAAFNTAFVNYSNIAGSLDKELRDLLDDVCGRLNCDPVEDEIDGYMFAVAIRRGTASLIKQKGRRATLR